jgi:hypothetical protein
MTRENGVIKEDLGPPLHPPVRTLQMLLLMFRIDPTLSGKPFLPSCMEVCAVNHTTVTRALVEARQTIWPDVVKINKLLPLAADAHRTWK